MIPVKELDRLAKARLTDAKVLFNANRYDGALYLCGYAIEIGLKLRICKTLKWAGFPSTNKEFDNFKSFKVHNLDVLLNLTGIEAKVKLKYLAEWSIVTNWDAEARYNIVGTITKKDADDMIRSAETLLKVL